jgi:hypothetical protein
MNAIAFRHVCVRHRTVEGEIVRWIIALVISKEIKRHNGRKVADSRCGAIGGDPRTSAEADNLSSSDGTE